jgi:hypothetical protein
MITVDDDDDGGYLVRAVGAMPPGRTPADIVRLHTDADAAAVFGDVGRYESFECSENVCFASWKVGKMTVAVRKRVIDDRTIEFESTDDSHVRTEGSWTIGDQDISIRQLIFPPVPPWLPRALVRRVIRGKFRNVYDDINKTSFFK